MTWIPHPLHKLLFRLIHRIQHYFLSMKTPGSQDKKVKKVSKPKKVEVHKIPNAIPHGPVPYAKNPVPIVPPDLFVLHTLCAFVGARGSGKTHAMVKLAHKYLEHRSINRVFIITPTYQSNKIFEVLDPRPEDVFENVTTTNQDIMKILAATQQDAEKYREFSKYLKAYKKYRRGREHSLSAEERTMLENNQFKKPNYMPRPSPLLIVDDMSHTNIYTTSKSNPFINLCLRHRHINEGIGMTIFMAAQTYKTGVPKAIRQNIQQFFIFPTKDTTQLESIYEEVANLVPKEQFLELYEKATHQPHSFLTVDNNPRHPLLAFRKNFDSILVPGEDEEEKEDEKSNSEEE